MKKYLIAGLLLALGSGAVWADTKISQMPSGGSLTSGDVIPILRGGSNFQATYSPSASGVVSFTGDGVVYNNTASTGAVTLSTANQNANLVFAGPSTGAAVAPTFRSLVGGDLPAPGLSSLGGINAINTVSHDWISSITTAGAPVLTQPAFSDISGTAAVTQGGTGATTLTSHGVLLGQGTSAVTAIEDTTTAGWVLTATTTDPQWQALSAGSVTLGTTTTAANPSISGDATSGLYTAGASKVDVAVGGSNIEEWSAGGSTQTGTKTITSSASTAFVVGANGTSNPVFAVDASTSSVIGGIVVKGAIAGGTTTITNTDSGSTGSLSILAKGAGNLNIGATGSGGARVQSNGATVATYTNLSYTYTPGINGGATTTRFLYTPAADTTLTASTDAPLFNIAGNGVIRQHSTGALTIQHDYQFNGTTDSFVGASTLTDGATLTINNKSCGTNGTCTNESALYLPTQALSGSPTNSYKINAVADSGATNNYAAKLDGLVTLPSISSDATHTTATVCEDTTSHNLYSGSGTAGICLGTSSARYKNSIVSMRDGLSEIVSLKPINFFYKKGYGDNGTKEQYGFLAEDMIKVLPVLVDKDKDGKANSVDLMGLVPILVHAVQEQQKEINHLKETLENK